LPELGRIETAPATIDAPRAVATTKDSGAGKQPSVNIDLQDETLFAPSPADVILTPPETSPTVLDELVSRGLMASAATNLLNAIPAARRESVPDYIEYWDFIKSTKQVGAGLLYELIKNGDPLPPAFQTRRQQAARRAAEERRDQLIMAKQSFDVEYDEYVRTTVDRFVDGEFKEEFTRRVEAKTKELNNQRNYGAQ
jgi:hypothetical protein